MFEKALVLRPGHEEIDIGLLAETTFFYGTTQLLLNRGAVCALVRQIPERELIGLFDRNAIQLSYLREAFSVHTSGIPQVHDLGAVQLHSTGVGEKKLNYREEIELALEREQGKSAETRRLARMIGDRVKLHRLRFEEPNESIPDLARRDLRDAAFVKRAIVAVLMPLDFDLAGGENEKLAIAACRGLLANGSLTEGRRLWAALMRRAQEVRLGPSTLDVSALWAELRTQFALRDYPDFRSSWDRLRAITADYRAEIQTVLPTHYALERKLPPMSWRTRLQRGQSALPTVNQAQASPRSSRRCWTGASLMRRRSGLDPNNSTRC
jgi:hypothetical protein